MDAIKKLKVSALVPLAFLELFLLLFGIGEMAGGDFSGMGHLILAVVLAVVMWAGWRYPLWSGLFFIIAAGLAFAFVVVRLVRTPGTPFGPMIVAPLVILVIPLLASGLLLLAANRRGRHTPRTP
jgi:hypothetical protein